MKLNVMKTVVVQEVPSTYFTTLRSLYSTKKRDCIAGKLPKDWPRILKKGVDECFRILEDYGVLIFKWNEEQITVREVLNAIERQPLFGHTTGRHGKTMWMCFIKLPINSNQIE